MTEPHLREATGLAQIIVLLVDKAAPATDVDGIAAAALASVQAYRSTPEDPAWATWLSGPFTKSVRRADAKTYAKIQAAHPEAVEAVIGDDRTSSARALGFAPLPMDALPKDLSRLQVSGTTLPAGDIAPSYPEQVYVLLNRELDMTTGKAAAQAAHALFSWVLAAPTDEVRRWVDAGRPVHVVWVDGPELEDAAGEGGTGPLIRDAGRTEIEPGSATAVVAPGWALSSVDR